MNRTISIMVGKGSVRHNSRKFHATNTDLERSHLNICFCNEPIKKVYQDLFSTAVKDYNAKQNRNDRKIENYYEKIRCGKQEKLFHEIILQIGNKDDMSAKDENGELAAKILSENMEQFQNRNPNLKVFSAHLHLDEATPHLHIDFVPFITGSKRGLETRVSLKQALFAQGFRGGTRSDNEWCQWTLSEKQQLAKVMEKHNVFWERKDTHEKHLSVLDFEKKMRTQEIVNLDAEIEEHYMIATEVEEKVIKAENNLSRVEIDLKCENSKLEKLLATNEEIAEVVDKYNNDIEWQLPEPSKFTTAKNYKEKIVQPLINKFKKIICSLIKEFNTLKSSIKDLQNRLYNQSDAIIILENKLENTERKRDDLIGMEKTFKILKKELGDFKINEILISANQKEKQNLEQSIKQPTIRKEKTILER